MAPVRLEAGVQEIEAGELTPLPCNITWSPSTMFLSGPAFTVGLALIVMATFFVLTQPFNDAVTVYTVFVLTVAIGLLMAGLDKPGVGPQAKVVDVPLVFALIGTGAPAQTVVSLFVASIKLSLNPTLIVFVKLKQPASLIVTVFAP